MPSLTVPLTANSPTKALRKTTDTNLSLFEKSIKAIKNESEPRELMNKKFFVRDIDNSNGFSLRESLPRIESYVPYGIYDDSRVVFAKVGDYVGFNQSVLGIKPYTTEVSQERRSLAASELGAIVLHNKHFTEKAVDKISRGVELYLQAQRELDRDKSLAAVVNGVGHYFFTNGKQSFGRISEEDAGKLSDEFIWNSILNSLKKGSLDQKMAIHDAIGRKVLPKLGGIQLNRYKSIEKTVRQDWFDKETKRGRAKRKNVVEPSFTAGITNNRNVAIVGKLDKSRNRGVDMFERDMFRQSDQEANVFFDDMDSLNLLFGAGISGTTGSLFQAAEAFGPLEGEEKKQYMFAIVGYLVGGGMHSFHEVMSVGKKIGIPYDAGSYVKSLPESFKKSDEFRQWNHNYYDISELGATHWRFNEGKLPSHLELAKLSQQGKDI